MPKGTKAWPAVTFVVGLLNGAPSVAQGLEVVRADGGSVTTSLGYGIAVNEESSLHREWFVANDPTCPLQLDGAGVRTVYADRDYEFQAAGRVIAREATAAFEVRFMLFDVWGEHMKTLSGTELRDLAVGAALPLSEIGSWNAWETEVAEFLTSVAFIAHVRTADGRAWGADRAGVLREVEAVKLSLTQEELEPSRPDD